MRIIIQLLMTCLQFFIMLNRLNSTASNCSGDSAAGISLNTIDRETLEPLQEKKESIAGDYESLRPLSRTSTGQQGGQIYCCTSEACPTLGPRDGRIYEVLPRKNSQNNRRGSRTEAPAVPPRFATIRWVQPIF